MDEYRLSKVVRICDSTKIANCHAARRIAAFAFKGSILKCLASEIKMFCGGKWNFSESHDKINFVTLTIYNRASAVLSGKLSIFFY